MRLMISRATLRFAAVGFVTVAWIAIQGMSSASAAKLNPAHVPADAQWLVHIDYESLSDSAMWQKIRDEKPGVSKLIQGWAKKRYGIDPSTDLKSMTLFSRDYREYTGTVIVHAEYDAAKMEDRLRKAMKHRTTKWKDHTLHTVTLSKPDAADDAPAVDEDMTVVMVDQNTILLASSVAKAQESLQLLAGDAPSLKGKDSPLLTDKIDQAWCYGAAINLGDLKDHPVSMPIIEQHQQINWSLGEQPDGKLYEKAEFVARSEDVAKKMKIVLDGLVAFESLRAEGSEALMALIDNVEVKHDGKTTGFHWQGSSDQLVAALDEVFARMETWKPMLMHRK